MYERDGQTHGQTPHDGIYRLRLHSIARQKSNQVHAVGSSLLQVVDIWQRYLSELVERDLNDAKTNVLSDALKTQQSRTEPLGITHVDHHCLALLSVYS